MRTLSTQAANSSSSEVLDQEPARQGPAVQAANTQAAAAVIAQEDPQTVARTLLKDPQHLEAQLAEVERKHGAAFAAEVRTHVEGWHGRPKADKRVSWVGEGGGYLSAGRLGANERTGEKDFARFGTGQEESDLHGSVDKRGIHARKGIGDDQFLDADMTTDGRSQLSRPYDRLYGDRKGIGLSSAYESYDAGGDSFRAGTTVRGAEDFDLDASWYSRTGGERNSLGLTDRDGRFALRGAHEETSAGTTRGVSGFVGDTDYFGLEYNRRHIDTDAKSADGWHAGFRQDSSRSTVYGGFGHSEPGLSYGGNFEFSGADDYSASLSGNTYNDRWSLGGSVRAFVSESLGASQALRVDAATKLGEHFILRGYGGLRNDNFLDEPAYQAGYGGVGLTFTHRDRLALTGVGLIDTQGNWEAGLQVDVFSSKLKSLGELTAGKKRTLFNLFVGVRGGNAIDAFDDHMGRGSVFDSGDDAQFFVSIGIGGR